MGKKTEVISKLADFIVKTGYRDIPDKTIRLSKELILHCLGGALAGAKRPPSKIVISFVKALGGPPEAAVMGAGFKSSAVNAAFVGGVTPHAIEVEDGSWPGAASPITVLPVAFALAEKLALSGKDILEAFVIGFEVQGKLAAECPGGHKKGVSLLATMGTFGAAAAAAKMLKLNLDQVKNALGLTASKAAGLIYGSAGYMTHYFQSGASCRNGLTAVLLAREGFNANTSALEMKNGLLDILCGEDGYDTAKITKSLGAPFHIEQVRMKKYPGCTLNDRVVDGVLALVKGHDISPGQVKSIEIEVNSALPRILAYPEPKDGEEAKFSLPYNVATTVLERKLILEDFTDEKVAEPKRREFMKKIKVIVHPEWDSDSAAATNPYLEGTNPVVIKLNDGREFRQDCAYATGGPESRLSTAEVAALYRPMARQVLAEKDVMRIEELVLKLESVKDLTELNGLLLG